MTGSGKIRRHRSSCSRIIHYTGRVIEKPPFPILSDSEMAALYFSDSALFRDFECLEFFKCIEFLNIYAPAPED